MKWPALSALSSLFVMVLAGFVLNLRRQRLNLADLLFISFGLTYGAGLFLSAFTPLTNIDQMLFERPNDELLIFAIVIAFYLVLLTVYCWEWIFPAFADQLRFPLVREAARRVHPMLAFCLAFLLLCFILYGTVWFGIVGSLNTAHTLGYLAIKERIAPYWYSSLNQLFKPLLFSLAIIVGANLGKDQNQAGNKTVWMLLTLVFLVIAFVYGRRDLMYGCVFLISMTFDLDRRIVTPKVAISLALAFALLLVGSNMYEYYRTRIGETTVMDIVSHWNDFRLTIRNVNTREPEWIAAYMATEGIGKRPLMMGNIMLQDARNQVPAFLVGEKSWVSPKRIINAHFDWPRVNGEMGPITPIEVLIMDWGPLVGLLVGVGFYIFGILVPAMLCQVLLHRSKFLQVLAFGGAMYTLINVEIDLYAGIFLYWKYLLILGILSSCTNVVKMVRVPYGPVRPCPERGRN